jgi:hypothetical protein
VTRAIAIAVAVAVAALFLGGCTSRTEFGHCIGAFDDGDPGLVYKASGWNIAMGILFVELIVPPVLVVVDQTRCPVARKPLPEVRP